MALMGSLSSVTTYFNLTQPVRVATESPMVRQVSHRHFNLTQPMWVATANLYKRSNKLSCILYNVCLLFDQTIWSDTAYCNGIISFLYIILGAKRPTKPCSLIVRTCSKQKYRHLIMRWRYVDFEYLFAFIFGMYSVYLLCSKLQCHFPKKPRTIPFTKSTRGLLLITPSSISANTIAPAIKTIRRIVNIGRQIRQ